MKVKTAELAGAALDWAVAKCEGIEMNGPYELPWVFCMREPDGSDGDAIPEYSINWSQGGPIIEHETIALFLGMEPEHGDVERWGAFSYRCGSDKTCYGPTPLVAAMRARVASKLGDEIEIPEELL